MILINCGSSKLDTSGLVRARDLYTGAVFKVMLETALTLDSDVRIFSALYGVIRLDDLVRSYDVKMDYPRACWFRENYNPPIDENAVSMLSSFYKHALKRDIKSLIPEGLGIGEMMAYAISIRGPTLLEQVKYDPTIVEPLIVPKLSQQNRPGVHGICGEILNCFINGPITCKEIDAKLREKFGPPVGLNYMPTIRTQLSQLPVKHDYKVEKLQRGREIAYRFYKD